MPAHPTLARALRRALPALAVLALAGSFDAPSPLSADGPTSAAASDPYQARQAERVREAVAAGRSARAILPILELWRSWNDAAPAPMQAWLSALASDRRLATPVRQYAAQLHARGLTRVGDPDGSRRAFDALGYVRAWRVVGPFDNEGKAGFDAVRGPEEQRMGPIDADARFEGRERPVGWREFPDVSQYGYVSFDAVHRPDTNVCSYAETFVTSERAQPLSLWIGAGGAVRAWWNGVEVLRDASYRQPDPDRSVAMVGAHAGTNRLLVKVCVASTTWGFFARLGDPSGAPARGLSFASTGDASEVHAGHGVARLPAAPVAPLAALEQAAAGADASPASLFDLARFLMYTGADDPAELRARQLAARAFERGPDADRAVLAAQLVTERGEAQRFLDQAARLAPDAPGLLLARARLASTGPAPEDALPLLDRLPAGTATWLDGVALRAELLVSLGLPETALAHVAAAARQVPGAPRFVALEASAAGAAGQREREASLRERFLALRHDDLGVRRLQMADALSRGARDEALAHLEVFARLGGDSTMHLGTVAEAYDALADEAAMMGAHRAAIDLAPEDAEARASYGRALLRAGQRDAAQQVLREAVALRPQDADTRELLETIQPEQRADEAYAVDEATLLERVRDDGGWPSRILQNLTVNTVFESGLGASFHQVAAQIVDAEGARSWRTYPIQFDPDVQRVTLRAARVYRDGRRLDAMQSFEQQLGEPWYRIWYDTRALVVVFPDLEPGDVVELRWRIDDVAERNQFHDYYGDLHVLAGQVPIEHMEYVLVTPSARRFYFNEPRLPSLVHEERVEGARRVDRFVATGVPAIQQEEDMPGMTEVAPYLHVSTYRTWEDVGRWYWGLVHDQLYADEHLREVVRGLVADAPDTRTKVQRIYDWVIRNTRYVGLEFGIHGFLPYRVPQIVQRGFGDCKDKASLIYTMLREAGIDARITLVRTRRNGAITDLPASLAVFDHAIAYVPELDLFLDGTAEYSGPYEFPTMDQGVTVLVVGPDGATLRRTPVLPAEANLRARTMSVELSPDGRGRVTVDEQIVGSEAPGYRVTYQAEGTRADRFTRALRGVFPGIELRAQRFDGLATYGDPVRVHYEADVPQFAQVDADGLRVRGTVLDELTRSLAGAPTRRHPLDLSSTSSYSEERRLRIPQGMRVLQLPAGGEARSPFGHLELRYEATSEREVTVRCAFALTRDVVAPDEYDAFRRWVEQADELLRQRISLGGRR